MSRIDRTDESLSPDLLQGVQQTKDEGASLKSTERYSNRRTRIGFEQAGV